MVAQRYNNFADFKVLAALFGIAKLEMARVFQSDKQNSSFGSSLRQFVYLCTHHNQPLKFLISCCKKEPKPRILKGKTVLYFYPKDSTPGCTAEACDLRDNYERFLALGYNVLGVSRDSASSHQRFIAKYNLPFHLIADTDLTILKAYEAWGEKKMYGKVTEGTLRTTYVIDEEGVIIEAIGKVDTKNHSAQII